MSEESDLKTMEVTESDNKDVEEKPAKDEEFQVPSQPSNQDIEKMEEAKLKARYPKAIQPMSGHSAFLQKRLAKGQKFFDSGDYQMAKQKGAGSAAAKARVTPALPPFATGDAIPTPETVPVRKTSIIQQPKLNFSNTTT